LSSARGCSRQTFHHFWKAFDRLLEALQHLLDLFFQGHLNEDAQARAELGGVKKRHAAGDDACFLKRSHASKTWRGGQTDAFGERDIRETGVLLDFSEDPNVCWIESLFQRIMPSE
jgi:hypothetical protein